MQNLFTPDEIDVLAKVIDEVCRKLSIVDDATKQFLAERLLDYAAQGERDFETLFSIAVNGKAVSP